MDRRQSMGAKRDFITSRRITAVILSMLILTACFIISAVSVSAADDTSSAEYVKSVAKAVNARKDTPDMFYAGDAYEFDLTKESLSRTFFAFRDFKAEDVEGHPELVDYSCKIPGVATASYCTAFDACFIKLPKYSEWVEVEGTLRIIILDDGTRKIDISGCDNAFAAYATFKYINPYYFSLRNVDVSQGYNSSNRNGVVAVLASLGSDAYARMKGYTTTQEYIDAVVLPELKNAADNADKWLDVRNQEGFTQTSMLLKVSLVIMALPVLYGLYRLLTAGSRKTKLALDKSKSGFDRAEAIRTLNYDKHREALMDIAVNDRSDAARRSALARLKYPEDRDAIRRAARVHDFSSVDEQAVKMLSYPEDKDLFIDLIKNSEKGQFAAFEKLKYPEDRDVFIMAARTNTNPNLRVRAVDKLEMADTVKAESDALDYVIRHDDYDTCRLRALGKLSYPANRKTIRYAAEHDSYLTADAVGMLSPSDDKDLIIKFAKDERNSVREEAINKLRYQDGREILIKAAENDKESEIRYKALEKLSAEKDHEVICRVLENDTSSACRLQALRMLSYDKAHEAIVNTALKDEVQTNRLIAIEKLRYPQDKETLAAIAGRDKDAAIREAASERLPFTENRDAVVKEGLYTTDYDELSEENIIKAEKAAVVLAFEPENTKKIKRFLCKNIQRGLSEGDKGRHTTLAGWSAAALGRVLALSFKPSKIEANYKRIKPAFEKYNEYIEQVQFLYEEFNECRDDFTSYRAKHSELLGHSSKEAKLRSLSNQINSIHSELAPGPGNYMIDNGDEPMAYLVHILRNNESRVPRFIKQGVIMGLLDWLTANRSDPEAAELLSTVLEVRKDMITTDDKLSFFEVRVPDGCIRHDYERMLADVLHCANPSVRYADMTELMDIAEKEVPGCMDMLAACPLRIIDPVNQTDLGFYQFEPYIHRMWYLYQPPHGTGKVNARYHEVDDRTRPLSSGLNLKLFTDPYSVIPTLFHEHEHFAGDVNEASVFLKTQMFSISFYKKYPGAKPARDVVFATLTDLLGMPPAAGKREALNDLIRKYYGEQTTRAEAEKRADGQLNMMNLNINLHNMNERWCPDIKYPLLNDVEDKKNMTIIRDSIIRFSCAPKSLTDQEYKDIIKAV